MKHTGHIPSCLVNRRYRYLKKPSVFQALLHSGFVHFSGIHFKPLDRFSLECRKIIALFRVDGLFSYYRPAGDVSSPENFSFVHTYAHDYSVEKLNERSHRLVWNGATNRPIEKGLLVLHLLHYTISLKKVPPLFYLIISEPTPIVTRSHTFSRAFRQQHVITSNFDWFIGLFLSFAPLWVAKVITLLWFYDTHLKPALCEWR